MRSSGSTKVSLSLSSSIGGLSNNFRVKKFQFDFFGSGKGSDKEPKKVKSNQKKAKQKSVEECERETAKQKNALLVPRTSARKFRVETFES